MCWFGVLGWVGLVGVGVGLVVWVWCVLLGLVWFGWVVLVSVFGVVLFGWVGFAFGCGWFGVVAFGLVWLGWGGAGLG